MTQTPRVFRISPKRSRKLELVLLLCGVVVPMIMLGVYAHEFELLDKLVKVLTSPDTLFAVLGLILLVPGSIWVERRQAATARLTVDARGLRMESGLPWKSFLGPLAGWECRWDEIDRVSVLQRFGVVRIRRKGSGGAAIPVRVTDWIEDGSGAGERATVPTDMKSTPLWVTLDDAGLFSERYAGGGAEAIEFDLARHPATRAALAVSAILLVYAAVDGAIVREAWAEWSLPYLMPHVIAGVLAAVAAAFAIKTARGPAAVPNFVVVVLAVILGFVAGCASWTGMIRVNQVFGGPLHERDYVRNQTCDALVPREEGLPAIEYTELARDYWCQFPADRAHVVLVRRGLFGLYQVDLTRHTEAIREFRRARGT